MTTTAGPEAPDLIPTSPTLVRGDIESHSLIGRTEAFALVAFDGFLKTVVPGMHRYPAAAPAPTPPQHRHARQA